MQIPCIQIDVENFITIPKRISEIVHDSPMLDSVMITASLMSSFDSKDGASSSIRSINSEVTVNVTAAMVLAHLLIPHFLSLQRPTTIIAVSSVLAFISFPFHPV